MCVNTGRLQEIKCALNQKIKLVNISYVGIKSDAKKIGIQNILQNLSKDISIPSSESFIFFDFKNARESINGSVASDEYKKIEIQRINDFENEFTKFKDILIKMENAKDKINRQFIKGTYKDLKLVYFKDLDKISLLNNQINNVKKKIDTDKFGEGITAFIESFRYKIRGEIKRHKLKENDEFIKLLEQCFNGLSENEYINRINIRCKYIVDISKQILTDVNFINELDKMSLEDEDKDLIKEYYRLSKAD